MYLKVFWTFWCLVIDANLVWMERYCRELSNAFFFFFCNFGVTIEL